VHLHFLTGILVMKIAMKIFYSELAENPAYYSFGYSIYGTVEEGDSIEEQYEKGFLPAVVAKSQPGKLMYQARSVRVLAQEFVRKHYHHRVARKAEALGLIEVIVCERKDITDTKEIEAFFLRYFSSRFGKDAMPEDRLRDILNSGWVTHISEYRIAGKPIACMLECQYGGLTHVWYQAYDMRYEHAHLGSYLYLLLIERAKAEGKRHVNFGVSYGSWMKYKTNFTPLEYWNGQMWVRDGNGNKTKGLFDEGISLVPYTDRFRTSLAPYYPGPTAPVFRQEVRLFQTLFDCAPRIALALFALPALLVAGAVFLIVFR
jgi:arginyl-tRNA--protein-N-Asp/Glu arginylyltransferase